MRVSSVVRPVRARAGRYWWDAVGPDRTPRANRHLAYFLALLAGVLNSVGFVAVAQYTSHMTGVIAHLADDLVLHGLRALGIGATALACFIAGAGSCALLFNWARRREMAGRYAIVLAFEALLVLAFGVSAESLEAPVAVNVAVLCFTMGLQNAVITKISGAQIRTTHVTGMVTDIGIELGKAIYRRRPGDPDPVRADLGRLRMHATTVLSFFLGGVLGAGGFLAVGYRALVPGALLTLLLCAPPLLADLRGSRGRGRGADSRRTGPGQ
ncbi:YoaK family protein [Yimella radicis]